MNSIKSLLAKLFFARKLTSAQTTDSAVANNSAAETTGNIVAAKVTRIIKHPNADRLRVIALTDGITTHEPVVCGAFNFNEGDIVALALPGAHIAHNIHSEAHESFTLGTAKIRGIESQGMICAAFELGLSNEIGEGVMILPEGTHLGKIIA